MTTASRFVASGLNGSLGTYTVVNTNSGGSGVNNVITVNFANQANADTRVHLALSTSASTPSAGEYIEFNALIAAYGVLERTGIIVPPGYSLLASANLSTTNVVAWGITETV
jgi:hypothetical protein